MTTFACATLLDLLIPLGFVLGLGAVITFVIIKVCRLGAGIIFGIVVATGLGHRECGGGCAGEGTAVVAALIGIPAAGYLGNWALRDGKRTLIYSAP